MRSSEDQLRRILIRASNNDLWQQEDGTTREYDHQTFGFSDYIQEVTDVADEASKAGLIELKGKWRRWALTEAGERWLAENAEGNR